MSHLVAWREAAASLYWRRRRPALALVQAALAGTGTPTVTTSGTASAVVKPGAAVW